jgi:hypothetical protein
VRLLILLVLVIVAVLVGASAGWRWVAAPLLGAAVLTWLLASLRVLVHDGRHRPDDEGPLDVIGSGERTLYWCEECGTEVLLLVRGSRRPPSHCGQRMHERTEMVD